MGTAALKGEVDGDGPALGSPGRLPGRAPCSHGGILRSGLLRKADAILAVADTPAGRAGRGQTGRVECRGATAVATRFRPGIPRNWTAERSPASSFSNAATMRSGSGTSHASLWTPTQTCPA